MDKRRLVAAEDWFEFFAERLPAPTLLAREGKIVAANQAMHRLFNCAVDDLKNSALATLFHPADFAHLHEYEQELKHSPGDALTHSVRLSETAKDSISVTLQAWGNVLDGEHYLFVSLSGDEESVVSRHLSRARRALRLLSQSNQTLIRSQEESQLLHDVCRLCVEQAGYSLAWIGIPLHDSRQSVAPLAAAGVDLQDIEALKVSWSSDPELYGYGPTGTAIRSGRMVVIHDIINSPLCRPWRPVAKRLGVASLIALPINLDTDCTGALTIGAPEPEAFDEQERLLLTELADDLAFGIRNLRGEKQRQDAADKLRLSEQALADAQEIVHLGSWSLDIPEGRGGWSSEMYRIFDAEPGDPAAMSLEYFEKTLLHPEDHDRVMAALAESMSEGSDYDIEYRIRLRDGKVRHIWARGHVAERDARGHPLRMIGTCLDISQRKEAEQRMLLLNEELAATIEELRMANEEISSAYEQQFESEERYRRMIESSPYGICVVQDGIIRFANASLAGIHHAADTGSLLGRHLMEFVPAAEKQRVLETIAWQAQSGYVSPLLTGQICREDGSNAHIEFRLVSIVWQGNPALQLFVQDISERVALERHLRQMQKLDALGTLAGGIAHDFNNLLSGILGFADLVADDLEPGSETLENLDEIRRAGMRARDLVQQILAFSRRSNPELVPVRLSSIVREAGKLMRASLPSTIVIRQELECQSDLVLANPTELHQVVMNLGLNAGQSMPDGGSLDIRLRSIEVDAEFAQLHAGLRPGKHIQLTVADTGQGIAPEDLERIFEPFYTTREGSGGTGLGLSVVYGIVSSLNGSVSAYSELGRGSAFHVCLPILVERPGADMEARPGRGSTRGVETILLVDDEPALLKMTQRILGRLGYTVHPYSNSQDALEAFRQSPESFDLLFTDQTMPELTGIRLTQAVLNIRPGLPVLLATGFAHSALAKEALAVGVSELISKPLVAEELASAVRRVLDGEARPPSITG